MFKYAKIIDTNSKLCEVGLGSNEPHYRSIGMVKLDVEQACNGNWYVKGYAPEKPLPTNEEQRQVRANAYANEIDPLHSQKQRRTILGTWTEEDEAEYVEKVKTISEDINNRYPYMENDEESGN